MLVLAVDDSRKLAADAEFARPVEEAEEPKKSEVPPDVGSARCCDEYVGRAADGRPPPVKLVFENDFDGGP